MATSSFNTVVKLDDAGAEKLLKALNSDEKAPFSFTPVKLETDEKVISDIIARCQKCSD